MITLKQVFDWIAGVESYEAQTPQRKVARYKNMAELQEHVVVAKDNDRFLVYTYDVTKHRMPTEAEKRACFIFYDKCKAIAAARHLIRRLHSTQEHPALVF